MIICDCDTPSPRLDAGSGSLDCVDCGGSISQPDIRKHGDPETESSYRHCACRDCFALTVGGVGVWCDDCIEADCSGACESWGDF